MVPVAGRSWREDLPAAVANASAPLVFLAVPDQHVHELAEGMARRGLPPTTAFVHVSGALPLAALAPLAEAGHPTGAFHPLQSFAGGEPRKGAFDGILAGVASTDPALEARLAELALAVGARPRRLSDEERPLYHAAAVMAGGGLAALAAQGCQALERAGWTRTEALEALLPLMRGVLDNLEREGLPRALTGPVPRADAATVRAHLAALRTAGSARPAHGEPVEESMPARVYRILGLAALELAVESGLQPDAATLIQTALTG